MPLFELLKVGGFTMVILLGCSVLSLGVIMERFVYYRRRSRIKRTAFMGYLRSELEKGK